MKCAMNRGIYCPYCDSSESEREALLIIMQSNRSKPGFCVDAQPAIDMNYEPESKLDKLKSFLIHRNSEKPHFFVKPSLKYEQECREKYSCNHH